jgi:hypothetical protein
MEPYRWQTGPGVTLDYLAGMYDDDNDEWEPASVALVGA